LQGRKLRAQFGAARPVWIAGSTHAGEEEQVLEAHLEVLKEQPDALLLLVPRHKHRFQSVADMLGRRGVRFERRSSGIAPSPGCALLLVDTVGELQVLYASADIAFVGGSLVPIGGHNLLEPAALGLPVLTGPYQFNNKEIASLLLHRGAALQASSAQELAGLLRRLLGNPAEQHRIGSIGRDIVESNRGSVSRLLDLIEPRLVEPRPAAHSSATS
jgi:3-deoxy-D-manno-octulosonic-acid transferase